MHVYMHMQHPRTYVKSHTYCVGYLQSLFELLVFQKCTLCKGKTLKASVFVAKTSEEEVLE